MPFGPPDSSRIKPYFYYATKRFIPEVEAQSCLQTDLLHLKVLVEDFAPIELFEKWRERTSG